MIYNVPEVTEYFNEETIHVLDYQCEYDTEIDTEKFPEFNNKIWKFFNSDTSFTTGHFKFGDVESGATMTLKVIFLFYCFILVQNYASAGKTKVSGRRAVLLL